MSDRENSDGQASLEDLYDAAATFLSSLPSEVEFWSAIIGAFVGAIVGGLIAYFIQSKVLREGRRQRAEDHKRAQEALGHSLIFKMIRIYSDFHGIRDHFESSFERAAKDSFDGEPWQIVKPVINPPSQVHFSAEEMGMLLALKDDEVFNSIISMDVIHNSLVDALKGFNEERRGLTARFSAAAVEGDVIGTDLNEQEVRALRPQMVALNSLIGDLRAMTHRNYEGAGAALKQLHRLLRDKLGLIKKLEFTEP